MNSKFQAIGQFLLLYQVLIGNGSLPDNILATDGALGHLFTTVGAGTHVATLQHHTVNLKRIILFVNINTSNSHMNSRVPTVVLNQLPACHASPAGHFQIFHRNSVHK